MKLKLNNSEMLSMTSLLSDTCEKYGRVISELNGVNKKSAIVPYGKRNVIDESDVLETMLYKSIFEELWVKFQKKSFDRQVSYTIDLKPHQALAIHIEFNGILDVTTYAGNLVQKICNNIHQQLSV